LSDTTQSPGWSIAIHGGAGVISRSALKPDQEQAYRQALAQALEAGACVLRDGGAALDAVEAAVRALEDDPLFNAGRGSVFTAEGRIEMDAAIMDGATLKAGAVAGLTRSSHPISVARAVMEKTDHVMLAGIGAEIFAEINGLESVEPQTLFTEHRWAALERTLKKRNLPIPPRPHAFETAKSELVHDEGKHGTVGAVARDQAGNLAAATATGGVTGKRFGRIGDSPIIGAGAYAANAACAVSATGDGEYFIRLGVARDIAALFEYRGLDIQAASDLVIQDKLTALGGQGGVIAVAPNGHIAWSFNSEGMYRASAAEGRDPVISIYGDEA
jgi:beta-aspartyl-peptidase (threonine type)